MQPGIATPSSRLLNSICTRDSQGSGNTTAAGTQADCARLAPALPGHPQAWHCRGDYHSSLCQSDDCTVPRSHDAHLSETPQSPTNVMSKAGWRGGRVGEGSGAGALARPRPPLPSIGHPRPPRPGPIMSAAAWLAPEARP